MPNRIFRVDRLQIDGPAVRGILRCDAVTLDVQADRTVLTALDLHDPSDPRKLASLTFQPATVIDYGDRAVLYTTDRHQIEILPPTGEAIHVDHYSDQVHRLRGLVSHLERELGEATTPDHTEGLRAVLATVREKLKGQKAAEDTVARERAKARGNHESR